jgi:phosphoglycerate dehydrogenase-like enzyme
MTSNPEAIRLIPATAEPIRGLIVCSERARKLIYETDDFKRIEGHLDWVAPPSERFDQDPEDLRKVEVLFTGWLTPPLSVEVLGRMDSLKAVFHAGGTVRGFVTEAFWDRGLHLANTHEANSIPVAEYTFSQIILGLKKVIPFDRRIRCSKAFPSEWYNEHNLERPPFIGSYGEQVGIIGLSMTGRKLVDFLKLTDLKMVAYDPYVEAGEMHRMGIRKTSLEELFATSRVVTLQAPETNETYRMVRAAHLRSLPYNGVFINTARGSLVDHDELVEVLKEREDIWAVLDVTRPEPPPPDSELFSLPNVMVTPHVAGALGSEMLRMADEVVRKFTNWRNGLSPDRTIKRDYLINKA